MLKKDRRKRQHYKFVFPGPNTGQKTTCYHPLTKLSEATDLQINTLIKHIYQRKLKGYWHKQKNMWVVYRDDFNKYVKARKEMLCQ